MDGVELREIDGTGRRDERKEKTLMFGGKGGEFRFLESERFDRR